MATKPGPEMKDPTPEDVYQFVAENSEPFVTSKDVAEEFDSIARRTLNGRLNRLHNEERIKKRKIGSNSVVWWVQEEPEPPGGAPTSDSASRRLPSSESQ